MSPRAARRVPREVWFAAGLLAVVLLGILAFHAIPGSDPGLLAPSGPDETVLRALRLAGIEHAAAGLVQGQAVAHVGIPALSSAPDVQIAWQATFATLVSAYPRAEGYTVILEADGAPLVRLDGVGQEVRDAVADDEAGALRDVFVARLLAEGEEVSADGLLAIGERNPDGYLDAKNRAAGLLDDSGPVAEESLELADAASAMRRDAPGVPAAGPGERAVDLYRDRLRAAVSAGDLPGGAERLAEANALGADPGRRAVARLRSQTLAAEALVGPEPSRALVRGAGSLAEQVASAPLESGPRSDAVLAAADAVSAPEAAADVRLFDRVPGSDFTVDGEGAEGSLPARVLRSHGQGTPPAIRWATAEGPGSAAPESWLAHQREDGALFWIAGQDGEVALTDATIRGWGFSRHRAALVDASRCGRVIVYLSLE